MASRETLFPPFFPSFCGVGGWVASLQVCVRTFMTLRRRMPMLILLIETSSVGNAHLPCFGGKPKPVVDKLRARFVPEVHDRAAMAHVNLLVDRSMKSWRTYGYDLYQNYAVGIAI